jgi:transcription elongation factor Elf1
MMKKLKLIEKSIYPKDIANKPHTWQGLVNCPICGKKTIATIWGTKEAVKEYNGSCDKCCKESVTLNKD